MTEKITTRSRLQADWDSYSEVNDYLKAAPPKFRMKPDVMNQIRDDVATEMKERSMYGEPKIVEKKGILESLENDPTLKKFKQWREEKEQVTENFDLVEKLQTYNNSKELRNNKAYKLLVENKVDTNEYLGIDKETAAGNYPIKEEDPKVQKASEESFIEDLLEFGNELKDSDIVTSIKSRVPEGLINVADFGTNIFNTFDKLFSIDENYDRSEIFNKWSDNLENARNKFEKQREDVEGLKSDWVGMIFQDVPAYVVVDRILKKAGIKKISHRAPLALGISYMMSFAEDEENSTLYIPSEFVSNLKHILGVLPDTPEDKLVDDAFQLFEGWGSAKLFQGLGSALKFIKRNTKAETVSDLAKGAAATGVLGMSAYDTLNPNEQVEIPPIDPNAKPIIDVTDPKVMKMTMNPAALGKLLTTKAGEVLPSLKKFGSKLFEKKTTSRFLKQAEEGKIGKDWYKLSGENILKYVGGDKKAADKFAQILAIYSPQKQIPHNTQFAIKAWNRFKTGQKIWDGEILEKAKLPEYINGKKINDNQIKKFKKDLLAKYGGGARVKGEKSTGLELVDLEDGNLMVVRHGTYENIAERAKDLKAHLLLNENIAWGGRKTNSFYGNIMKKIDPSIKQAATIDLWMNRAGGFVNKELKDGPKYNFIESVVGTVAKKKKWDIDQAQAAIWVSTKARFDTTKSLFSEKALKSGVGVRKGGHIVPVKGKEKEFADLRFNTAMNYKIASQDIEKAAINFADTLDDNLAFVSWETVPGSKYTKHLDGLENASSIIKSEYHFKVSKLLTDESGHDIISKKLGILSPGHFEAPGYFKGVSNPSGQTKIATTRIKGAGKDITTMDAPSQELLEKYAALRGIILSQDEIGYHRIIKAGSKKNANSVAIKTGNKFSAEQVKKLGAALDKEFGGGHALISKEKGVLVLKTGELQNIEFQKRLKSLVELAVDNDYTLIYYKNGNLITRGKTDYGKTYSGILGQIRRSDIRQLLRDILSKKKNLDKEFSEKYGFRYEEKAFEEIESFIQGKKIKIIEGSNFSKKSLDQLKKEIENPNINIDDVITSGSGIGITKEGNTITYDFSKASDYIKKEVGQIINKLKDYKKLN